MIPIYPTQSALDPRILDRPELRADGPRFELPATETRDAPEAEVTRDDGHGYTPFAHDALELRRDADKSSGRRQDVAADRGDGRARERDARRADDADGGEPIGDARKAAAVAARGPVFEPIARTSASGDPASTQVGDAGDPQGEDGEALVAARSRAPAGSDKPQVEGRPREGASVAGQTNEGEAEANTLEQVASDAAKRSAVKAALANAAPGTSPTDGPDAALAALASGVPLDEPDEAGGEAGGRRGLELSRLGFDLSSAKLSGPSHGKVDPVQATRALAAEVADAVRSLRDGGAGDQLIRMRGLDVGEFTAHIRLDGRELAILLHADDRLGRIQLAGRVDELRGELARAGLGDVEVEVDVGSDRDSSRDDAELVDRGLVDERADEAVTHVPRRRRAVAGAGLIEPSSDARRGGRIDLIA